MATPTAALPGARAVARHVRISPMKARRVVDLVRGLPAKEALTVLKFAPQAASETVYKVLASAIANAENNERLDPDSLLVRAAFVDEGATMKRFRPRAQGRAYRIRKRTCHITIEVESVVAAGAVGRGRTAAPARPTTRSAPKAAPARATKAAPAAEEETVTAPAKKAVKAEKSAVASARSESQRAPQSRASATEKAAPEAADETKPAKKAAKKAARSEEDAE